MKLPLYTIIYIVCLSMTGMSCKKKSDNPVENLPPLTTTGANTFGCLVNGQAFLPKAAGVSGREPLNLSYTVVNNKKSLIISVEDSRSQGSAYIRSFINSAEFKQGDDYILASGYPLDDNPNGHYIYRGPQQSYGIDYITNNQVTGKVHLTYFNEKIPSGTFSFDAVSNTGETVEIREGRFDLKFKNF